MQHWIADPPSWAEVHQTAHVHDPSMETLDAGEQDAIVLAVELHADLILMDDRDGVLIARRTSFHYQQEIMDQLLAENSGEV